MSEKEALKIAATCIAIWATTVETGKPPIAGGRKGSPYRRDVIRRLNDAHRLIVRLIEHA